MRADEAVIREIRTTESAERAAMRKMVLALLVCVVSGADAQDKRAQLDGVWILSGSATIEMMLTPAGEAARARYDYLRDDPAMQCIPASFTRVMCLAMHSACVRPM